MHASEYPIRWAILCPGCGCYLSFAHSSTRLTGNRKAVSWGEEEVRPDPKMTRPKPGTRGWELARGCAKLLILVQFPDSATLSSCFSDSTSVFMSHISPGSYLVWTLLTFFVFIHSLLHVLAFLTYPSLSCSSLPFSSTTCGISIDLNLSGEWPELFSWVKRAHHCAYRWNSGAGTFKRVMVVSSVPMLQDSVHSLSRSIPTRWPYRWYFVMDLDSLSSNTKKASSKSLVWEVSLSFESWTDSYGNSY